MSTIKGVRPAADIIPQEPGIYWVKGVRCGWYITNEENVRVSVAGMQVVPSNYHIIFTWDELEQSDWFIANIASDGRYEILWDSETYIWDDDEFVITQVGPKVEPPS